MHIYISKRAETEEEYIKIRDAVKSGEDIDKFVYVPERMFSDIGVVFGSEREEKLKKMFKYKSKDVEAQEQLYQPDPYKLSREKTKELNLHIKQMIEDLKNEADLDELEGKNEPQLIQDEKRYLRLYSNLNSITSVCETALNLDLNPIVSLD